MKISEAFARLTKLLPVHGKVTAILLRMEDGKLSVLGVGKQRAFGYSVAIDEKVGNFSFIVTPKALQPILGLNITDICVKEGNLEVSGVLGSSENSPTLKITCQHATDALAKETEALEATTHSLLSGASPNERICCAADVIKYWQALSKCGSRLFLTTDLTYALSASAAAFYSQEAVYENLPEQDGGEPIQMEATFPAEVQTLASVCGDSALSIFALKGGTIFLAASEDKSVFSLACASVPQKHTVPKAKRMYSDAENFATLKLFQSAVRDVLLTSADKLLVEITAGVNELVFSSGAVGKIKTDTTNFDCECEVAREHTTLALRALPSERELVFGYGESGAQTFISFGVSGVVILIPAQDITEI